MSTTAIFEMKTNYKIKLYIIYLHLELQIITLGATFIDLKKFNNINLYKL